MSEVPLHHAHTASRTPGAKEARALAPLPSQYRGTSLKRNSAPLGPYSRNMPRALWWSQLGGGCFLWARYPCSSNVSRVRTRASLGRIDLYKAWSHPHHLSVAAAHIYYWSVAAAHIYYWSVAAAYV